MKQIDKCSNCKHLDENEYYEFGCIEWEAKNDSK